MKSSKAKAVRVFSALVVSLMAVALPTIFNNCAKANFNSDKVVSSFSEEPQVQSLTSTPESVDTDPSPSAEIPSSNPLVMNKSTSLVVSSNNKVDVLVVVDNSGSMAFEQNSMATRFGSFLDNLKGLNWRLGITTTDVSLGLSELSYFTLAGSYFISSDIDFNLAQTAFAANIQRSERGSGDERGITAAYSVITNPQNTPSNANFFRPEATLSVLIVTDSDEPDLDISTRLLNAIKVKWPNQKIFNFNAIVVEPGDSGCLAVDGNENYGRRYADLIQATGGIMGSVCSKDYGSQLSKIGKGAADLVRTSTLPCAPLDLNGDGLPDIELLRGSPNGGWNKVKVGYKITNSRNILFDNALDIGNYRVKYSCIEE